MEQLVLISIEGPTAEELFLAKAASKGGMFRNRRIHWLT